MLQKKMKTEISHIGNSAGKKFNQKSDKVVVYFFIFVCNVSQTTLRNKDLQRSGKAVYVVTGQPYLKVFAISWNIYNRDTPASGMRWCG